MPSYEPFNWNIVVNAAWNRAILTPGGVATRLFRLPPGSGIEVLVPIEGIEPPKVVHEGIIVTASSTNLVVDMKVPDYDGMERALAIAREALNGLPETPVSAAGFNVRYRGLSSESEFSRIVQSPLDALSDSGFEIMKHGILRQIRFGEGVINLKAEIASGEQLTLELNFHRDSRDRMDLLAWLSISKESLQEGVTRITSALGIPTAEETHVPSN